MNLQGSIDPLGAAEEKALVTRWQQHKDYEARDRMVAANLRFVHETVIKFLLPRGTEYEDAVQAGCEGLLTAIDRFDPNRGFKFISYAVFWIRQGIFNYVHLCPVVVRPINHPAVAKSFLKHEEIMSQYLGYKPNFEDVLEQLKAEDYPTIPLDTLRRQCHDKYHAISLSHSVLSSERGEHPLHNQTLEELLYAIGPEEAWMDGKILQSLLKGMPARMRQVLCLYYGLDQPEPMTLDEVGKVLGLTRERIRQIKEQGLTKLRFACKNLGVEKKDVLIGSP